MAECINRGCTDCENAPGDVYERISNGDWDVKGPSECDTYTSRMCDVTFGGVCVCEHCGEKFDGLYEAGNHEEKCPRNPEFVRESLLSQELPDLRACGTCALRDASGYVSADCPHKGGDPRRNCLDHRLATELFWRLRKDVKPVYSQEVFACSS